MTQKLRLHGLRSRFILAFICVTVVSVGTAAWASGASTTSSLLALREQQLASEFASRIEAVTPRLRYPPDENTLEQIAISVGGTVTVSFRDRVFTTGSTELSLSDDLRRAVSSGERVVIQRTTTPNEENLLLGTPVMLTAPNGVRRPSGVEVYTIRSLNDVQNQIDQTVQAALLTTAFAVPLSGILALLVTRRVLRPIRDLRDTARQLASGDLNARSFPTGSDELTELTQTINDMANSIQKSIKTMERMEADARRFAADMSHELRTPLSTLVAVTEVLTDATADMKPEVQESAQLAITETHRLVRLVEDLMEISRFDAGTALLKVELADIIEIIHNCLALRGWGDQVEVVGPKSLFCQLDHRRIDVIIANLIGNAIRHGKPPVQVAISTTESTVEVKVIDHGPGFSQEVGSHIFDRFYKADAARVRSDGSGLGLAIARENALLHGGTITATSVEHGGAQFLLSLPRIQGRDQKPAKTQEEPE
ncbi:HAMP domain-containing sensor histidine kinase [Lysinibacter sp. HNR]|uniref:sensor histidine kinase n=1 Tax=Lysinibacter sp. HNR TaxID=3031408 RepID=UPI00243530E9|nr:HAMP domain-containing sensor histidine kinase [Lysinibacter sp. HNR]WGD37644.1 HAMP domain-containing sensor histidine kinase [Lysinibacter sp. HNR]